MMKFTASSSSIAKRLTAAISLALLAAVVLLAAKEGQGSGKWSGKSSDFELPPPGMVLVPGGDFWMGSDDPKVEKDERPLRRVRLPAFYIDRNEITNREYKQFKPSHTFPAGEDDFPATLILKPDAIAYATWAKKRLPTDAEWEKAARGTDGRMYPWGNTFEAGRCNMQLTKYGEKIKVTHCPTSSRGKTKPGSFPTGASPYGCNDMAGNVWEWVSDNFQDRDWLGLPTGEERGIIRGGAYGYSAYQGRSTYHAFEALTTTCHDVGFRCVMDAVPKR
ncbi:MAG TPA: SUMF1/EgtB/PvdO family nonheme iron enzyme [Roseimicrobium sp.]|nr:SUMF1/EgtB/PvdO family nonheme iron enzyme [Roseimicrobium sp.]